METLLSYTSFFPPLLLLPFNRPALIAHTVMAAYHSAAFRALPFSFFLLQESPHPALTDHRQVLYHTHVIFGPVAFIQVFDPAAGINYTFIAKTGYAGFTFFTDGYRAFAAAGRLVYITSAATRAGFSFPQMPHAYTAIHAARRYQ